MHAWYTSCIFGSACRMRKSCLNHALLCMNACCRICQDLFKFRSCRIRSALMTRVFMMGGLRLVRLARCACSRQKEGGSPRRQPPCVCSAAQHGARIRFEGVGGAAMEAAGLRSLFPMADLAVAGFVEVRRQKQQICRPKQRQRMLVK